MSNSRKQFIRTLETAGQVGLDYNSVLDMDIRMFNSYVVGCTKKRETEINDQLTIGHIISGKTAQAIWASKDFKKEIKPIKLTDDETTESRNRKVVACLKSKGLI